MKAVIALSILLLFGFAVADDVVVLTEDNFDEVITGNDYVLVEFYAPWCGHCKQLEPHYAKAATALKGSVVVAKVDATEETGLSQQYGIQGYPTVKFFKKGKFVADYDGERTSDAIVNWALKKSGPPSVHITSKDQYEEWSKKSGTKVVGFVAADSADLKAFIEVASDPASEDFNFAHVTDSALQTELGATAVPSIVVDSGSDVARYEKAIETEAALEFVLANGYPLTEELNQQVFRRASKAQRNIVVLFTNPDAGSIEDQMKLLTEIATKNKGQAVFTHIAHNKFANLASQWGASGKKWPVLIVVLWSKGQAKIKAFDEEKDIFAEGVSWATSCLTGGECPAFRKSEPVPESNDGDVKVIVGKTFEEIAYDKNKDVLVEFYAPWCGHCKKLAPTYEKLGKAFRSVDTMVIAKTDATANGYPDEIDIQGFPTIIFFPADNKNKPVKYEGDRTLNDFVEFLKKHATHKFKEDALDLGDNKDEL